MEISKNKKICAILLIIGAIICIIVSLIAILIINDSEIKSIVRYSIMSYKVIAMIFICVNIEGIKQRSSKLYYVYIILLIILTILSFFLR